MLKRNSDIYDENDSRNKDVIKFSQKNVLIELKIIFFSKQKQIDEPTIGHIKRDEDDHHAVTVISSLEDSFTLKQVFKSVDFI